MEASSKNFNPHAEDITETYQFALPTDLIAKSPAIPRDSSRMLYVNSKSWFNDMVFRDIPDLLCPGDILVCNDTKVMRSHLYGKTETKDHKSSGISVSINLTKKLNENTWQVLAKPGRKLYVGSRVEFYDIGGNPVLVGEILSKDGPFITLEFNEGGDDLLRVIENVGKIPIPPYMSRDATDEDIEWYQTVYAKHEGSVAAPTAGLHFTEDVLKEVQSVGAEILNITLHVGGGTFLPIKTETLEAHVMHGEKFFIQQNVFNKLLGAKREGRRIICVGTTSMRVLESIVSKDRGLILKKGDGFVEGETNIFIKPGHKFEFVDGLITNFHLPKSTLFVLVCAFLGYDVAMKAYLHAIAQRYRFFSYGDVCFFERSRRGVLDRI